MTRHYRIERDADGLPVRMVWLGDWRSSRSYDEKQRGAMLTHCYLCKGLFYATDGQVGSWICAPCRDQQALEQG